MKYQLYIFRYINAEIWLHGSCAGITKGLCGNWNGNGADDLFRNDPDAHGEKLQEHDEDCPPPPPPYHPCNAIGPDARAQAEAICNSLRGMAHFLRVKTESRFKIDI